MKYIKLFEEHSEYETYINSEDKKLPNLSYCKDIDDVHFNPFIETRLICKYNITNISNNTVIFTYSTRSLFDEIEIDGVVQPSIISSYKFDTIGEHTIKYTLKNPTVIANDTFKNKPLTSIKIPNSVITIGSNVFNGCSELTNIIFGNSVTSIGSHALEYCTSLTNLKLPNSLTSIGYEALHRCSNLSTIIVDKDNTVYDSRDNCNAIIETATNTLLKGCKNTIIPNSITSIGSWAFDNCVDLTNINIPNSVTVINNNAFGNCTGLTNINIPNSVTSIGYYSFGGCTGLTSITIPDSVTTIGDSVFYGCSELTNVTIGNGVTTIGDSVFYGCSELTNVIIGNSVTTIGEMIFERCSNLLSITSLSMTAPTIVNFYLNSSLKTNGTLYVPIGSTGYDIWMSNDDGFLGSLNWTKIEQ